MNQPNRIKHAPATLAPLQIAVERRLDCQAQQEQFSLVALAYCETVCTDINRLFGQSESDDECAEYAACRADDDNDSAGLSAQSG